MQRLIASTAGLELMKGECRRLPPSDTVYGPFTLTGNSAPAFAYVVFDESLMEFVQMTVELHLPSRITFTAVTKDLGEVRIKPEYKKPFYALANHLFRYFPFLAENRGAPTNVL